MSNISVDQFLRSCGCRSAGDCSHNSTAEFEALNALVDAFAVEMKLKLQRKALDGYGGWDDPGCVSGLKHALSEHLVKGDPIDVANIAAMLWNHNASTKP